MKKNIMVVDDNPDLIYSVKTGLENIDKGFIVTGVKNGEECFDFLKNNPKPDLILLDVMMPDIDGWELFDNIKSNSEWSNIPIIFLTARTDDAAENAGKFLAEDYIEKPFDLMDLKGRIDRVLEKKE